MTLDLRNEHAWLTERLRSMIRWLTETHQETPIYRITFTYDIDPGGFGTTVESDDGDYVRPLENCDGLRREWFDFDQQIFTDSANLITHRGDELNFIQAGESPYTVSGDHVADYRFENEGDHFIQALGLMFADVVKKLLIELQDLNLLDNSVYSIDELHNYFWPPYFHCDLPLKINR